jgi:hypothetical protein
MARASRTGSWLHRANLLGDRAAAEAAKEKALARQVDVIGTPVNRGSPAPFLGVAGDLVAIADLGVGSDGEPLFGRVLVGQRRCIGEPADNLWIVLGTETPVRGSGLVFIDQDVDAGGLRERNPRIFPALS